MPKGINMLCYLDSGVSVKYAYMYGMGMFDFF